MCFNTYFSWRDWRQIFGNLPTEYRSALQDWPNGISICTGCCSTSFHTEFSPFFFAEVTELEIDDSNGSSFICYLNFPFLNNNNEMNETQDANEYNLYEESEIQFGVAAIWKNYGTYQTLLTFLLAHVIPGIIIVQFTMKISNRLQQQQLRFRRLWEERKKASRVTLAVLILYFFCWTPYWFVRLISTFARFGFHGDQLVAKISIFCYTLPLLNASFNSVMYGFFNKSLANNYQLIKNERIQQRDRRSLMLMVNGGKNEKKLSCESEMDTKLISISYLSHLNQ